MTDLQYRPFFALTLIAVFLGLVGGLTARAQETTTVNAIAPQPMSPVDFLNLARLDAPRLSPDGTKLLYLQSHSDWKENRQIFRYRLTDLESGEALPVFGVEEPDESHGAGIWRPDGEGFITLLEREDDDTRQAYFFDLGEESLTRITSHTEDIGNITWAPDGQGFYFMSDRPSGKTSAEAKRARKWQLREYETRTPEEIWYHDIASGEARRIVHGAFYVRDYHLARDGSVLVYFKAPGGLGDDRHQGELWLKDLASGKEQQLTNNAYYEAEARLSPDNRYVTYIATVNEKGEPYYEDNLFLQEIGAAAPQLLLPDMAMEVQDHAWDATGTGLYIVGNIGLHTELFHYTVESGVLEQLTEGEHVLTDWSYLPGFDAHTGIFVSARNPGEVHVKMAATADFDQVTDVHADLGERFALPRQERVSWRGRGGVTIEGLLVYPVNYQEGERFPLVTTTHGGPRSSSQFGSWNFSRYVPVLAGQGYGVLLPNHRGGTGYGDKFVRDMVGGYFRNAHHDTLDGVDAMIDRGLADPEALVKMGWSAGGHMTNKIITVTDRFKVASSGAGASDWVSMYGESDIRHNRTPWFGGAPWERDAPLRTYRRHSPLFEAWKATTPTLIFVGERDVRVPPTQSIIFYRALKAAGVPTELYVAPGQPHGFRLLSYRLFKINKELDWFAQHLFGESFEPVLPAQADEPMEEEEE